MWGLYGLNVNSVTEGCLHSGLALLRRERGLEQAVPSNPPSPTVAASPRSGESSCQSRPGSSPWGPLRHRQGLPAVT